MGLLERTIVDRTIVSSHNTKLGPSCIHLQRAICNCYLIRFYTRKAHIERFHSFESDIYRQTFCLAQGAQGAQGA